MIIGSKFSEKHQRYLKVIYGLSGGDQGREISVQHINEELNLDRPELKNVLEFLDGLELIEIISIGGPLLYGHITITQKGIKKASNL